MDEGRTIPLPPPSARTAELTSSATSPKGGGQPIFLTIATGDRAAQARILAHSAREHHPDAMLIVVTPDASRAVNILGDFYDEVLTVERLGVPGLADMRFRYSLAEMCFALKPWAIRHLLERGGKRPVYYFDADIELFAPLVEVTAALSQGANIVLTPHVLHAGRDQERERALLRAGSFNAGFLAIAPTDPARNFVDWWRDRARTGCTHDPEEGTYGDQKWLDMAPSLCDEVVVLRHPGYNVAYWNAHERPLQQGAGGWTVAGAPLRFIHYSRWNLIEQNGSEYLREFFPDPTQNAVGLFDAYRRKVQAEDDGRQGDRRHCSAGIDVGGSSWPDIVRSAYARHAPTVDGDIEAVKAHAIAVLDTPSSKRPAVADLPMTVLYDEVWRRHANLRHCYAIDEAAGRLAFFRWLIDTGADELHIPAIFLKSARLALERQRVRDLEGGDGNRETARERNWRTHDVASGQAVTAHLGGLDAALQRNQRQQEDIRLLVGSNRGLRREVQSLRVRAWRDEERIAALEAMQACTRRELDATTRRTRQLAEENAWLRERPWRPLLGLLTNKSAAADPPVGRQILPGAAPLSEAGFRLGEGVIITPGSTVKRRKDASSGMVVYGPYVKLAAGTYAAAISVRLYRLLPLSTTCKLDVTYSGGQGIAGLRRCRLYSLAGWQRFLLPFTVTTGDETAEFEIRIWGRKGTPLEIAALELYERLP